MNAPMQMDPAQMQGQQPKKKRTAYDSYLFWGWLVVAVLLLVTVVWGFAANIKGAVIAPGYVTVEGKPKTVQHLDGGIVGEILVEEGDLVEKGQVIMRLDPTILEANQMIVETRLNETLARVARLEAERDGKRNIEWPERLLQFADNPAVKTAMDGQENLFRARQIAAQGMVGQLTQRVAQLNDQIDGLGSLISSKRSQLSLIQQELNGLQTLLDKGYVSKTRVLALEREQARLNGDLANHQSDISRLRNSIGETELQILQTRRERQEEVLTEMRQAQTDSSDLREQLVTAADQRGRINVRAPVSGLVHNMQVATIGGVVTPSQELMQIIPDDARLIIEAQVEPQDIDQIYDGQAATIRLSAFNQRKTPEMNGFVIQSSADRIIDQATGFPYYTVRLEIPPEELARLNGLELIPGMPAEAFMQTKNRSVMSYVMKPATDAMSRTFREE